MHCMSERKAAKISTIFIMCSAVCWGSIGLVSRPLLSYGLDPVHITFLRCSITAVTLIIFSALFQRESLRISGIKNTLLFIGSGVVGVALMYVFYFKTVDSATLSLAAVLLYTAPCFVLIMSCIFFKEKVTVKKIIALVIASAGCVLSTGLISTLSGDVSHISVLGVLTGAAAGLCYAFYTIISNQLLKTYSSLTIITYSFSIGTICLIPVCDFDSMFDVMAQVNVLPLIIPLSFCCTLLPYVLYTFGLNHVEPSKASIMALVEPVVATLWSILYFREGYTLTGLLGIVLVFVSIIILNIGKAEPEGLS